MFRRRVWMVCLAVMVSCGSTQSTTVEADSAVRDPKIDCVVYESFVSADQVVVHGDLSPPERELVDWALSRFALVDMYLPGEIEVTFDPTRVACLGAPGRCVFSPDKTPRVFICEEDEELSDEYNRKLTLLHELAHLWHAAHGDGDSWPDASPVVGGVANDMEAEWNDRSEERVADTISWGLSEQFHRPARGAQACDVLYRQFVSLTGVEPLPPIEPNCLSLLEDP